LIAPGSPAFSLGAGKEFKTTAVRQEGVDAVVDLWGLLGVLAARAL